MAFREVRVFEVREVLRLWLAGESLRGIERLAGLEERKKHHAPKVDKATEATLPTSVGTTRSQW